ncbi:MAG: translation initiation factor [Bacteroidetes bacterium]|nr:translation initiation factor [Bacteroidota bacterium]MBS1648389.1 translation initiation factor [Bacteroidota bacterium]
MNKKNKADKNGFVFSTNPQFNFEEEVAEEQNTLTPEQQKLKLRIDTKQRAGKVVTLVENFVGLKADAEILGKELKNYCGTGGSVKNFEILIQGDQRDKVLQFLLKKGYKQTKKI